MRAVKIGNWGQFWTISFSLLSWSHDASWLARVKPRECGLARVKPRECARWCFMHIMTNWTGWTLKRVATSITLLAWNVCARIPGRLPRANQLASCIHGLTDVIKLYLSTLSVRFCYKACTVTQGIERKYRVIIFVNNTSTVVILYNSLYDVSQT
jgi:hypothetical protein